MFDDLQRELRRLGERQTISVSMPSDEDGYFDRECPSSECQFAFKILEDDWREKIRDEVVFCPFCGHTADSDSWWTQEQIKHAERAVVSHVERRIGSAMRRDADRWNRRQPRNSFITMTMSVDSRPRHFPLPFAAEAMQLKVACPKCECRYAVVGAAFFCPVCGHNAAEQMFSQSMTAIANALDALALFRKATPDRDSAENTARLLIESGLQHAVTAFQRFAEALYARYPNAPRARRNAFQNLSEANDLWLAATGHQFADYMTAQELEAITLHFQRRHLVAHTQGIVDREYIDRTGDTAYRIGQRVVISESSVRRCVALMEKLAGCMASECPGTKEDGL